MAKVAKPFKYRGRWRICVTLDNGMRPTKDFDRHADAVQWAAQQLANANSEHQPVLGGPTQATLAQALNEYARVYSIQKGGVGAELTRINRYLAAANLPELFVLTNENGGMAVAERAVRQAATGFRGHLERRREQRTRTNAPFVRSWCPPSWSVHPGPRPTSAVQAGFCVRTRKATNRPRCTCRARMKMPCDMVVKTARCKKSAIANSVPASCRAN